MPDKHLKVPRNLTRSAKAMGVVDAAGRTVKLSISSDVPYLRYDYWNDEEYWEVLDHSPGGIDDERLKAGLPILFNHNRNDHLGRGISYEVDGNKCDVVAKFSESAFAEEKWKDVQQGILVDSSVGYELIGDGVCTGAIEGKPVYKFKFKIYEGSLVTIPADASVGIGRQRDNKPTDEPRELAIKEFDKFTNSDNNKNKANQPTTQPPMKITLSARKHFEADKDGNGGGGKEINVEAERKAALDAYKAKCKAIQDFTDGLVKHPAWQKAVQVIAKKHIEGDADFATFQTEANKAFVAGGVIDEPNNDEQGTVEVIGERRQPITQLRSIGHQFVNSPGVKGIRGGRLQRGHSVGLDLAGISMVGIRGKVAMAKRAGFSSADLSAVNLTVDTSIIPLGTQRLTILDVIGAGTIGTGAYKYARENGFGSINGVAVVPPAMPRAQAVGERGLKPTWEADLSTETANVAKVAITTKVPDEFLADFPSAMAYIDQRLPFMVDTETEFQVLYGDGLNDNLKGIMSTAGVQVRAMLNTNDSTVAASLRQGLTDIQVGAQFEPDFFAFHPYDWETAQLLKDDNKRFLAGGPYYIPYTDGVFLELRTFWGKPVVVTTAVSYGSPIAGAGKLGASALIREGMRIEMTNANEDDFRRNLICLRAEHRLALPVYRPVCFLQFTGFPARA